MTDVKETKENPVIEATKTVEASKPRQFTPRSDQGDQGGFRKNRRKTNKRREKQRSEFDQKILDIRRVTRVSSGGRRFSFAVSMVIGDRRGKIGVGTGKAGDTALAIEKATRTAKKNLITIKMTENNSIPHEVRAKYNSAVIMMMPAKGRGVIAGSAVRDIIDLSGMKDINAKIVSGSKNKLNIAKATIKALKMLKAPRIYRAKEKKVASNEK